ncbi:NAD(P)H-binding protein [Holzapfeliella floricola]|uniref:NAD(P)H-binding protein n=1 Tax=Holzapfeliella floricola TaxID=679249 RepID=UPI0023428A4C|nr:NAD(P)H-binding protein [Holzapfeliella floricola]
MKVFVAGANGRVGRHVVNKLIQKDDDVLAGVRDPKTQSILRHDHVATYPLTCIKTLIRWLRLFQIVMQLYLLQDQLAKMLLKLT